MKRSSNIGIAHAHLTRIVDFCTAPQLLLTHALLKHSVARIFGVIAVATCLSGQAHSSVILLNSPGGGSNVAGGLSINVDAYGAFGSYAAPAGDAFYNPGGMLNAAGTTYESAIFLRANGFSGYLAEGAIGGQPSVAFSQTGGSLARSSFSRDGLAFELTQEVQDRIVGATKTGSILVQNYIIRNDSTATKDFSFTRYLDGDLYFEGDFRNDFGGRSGSLGSGINLYEFDTGDNPSDPSTYVGIRSLGSTNTSIEAAYEVSMYPNLREKIRSGGALANSVAPNGTGYDVSLAIQRDFSLAAGETTFYTSVTDFGRGIVAEPPLSDIAATTHSAPIVSGGFAWNSRFDWGFSNQRLMVDVDIDLVGADPGSLASVWEQGIENIFSNRFSIIDGIYNYPIVFDVDFVDANADHTVNVIAGTGRTNMLNWYLDRPGGWDNSYHDEIAAHEFGHMLGLYDEYAGGAVNPNISPNTFTNSLMADLGPTQRRHYLDLLSLLQAQTTRDLSLAFVPFPPPPTDAPLPDFGLTEGVPGVIPEPPSLLIVLSALAFLFAGAGGKRMHNGASPS